MAQEKEMYGPSDKQKSRTSCSWSLLKKLSCEGFGLLTDHRQGYIGRKERNKEQKLSSRFGYLRKYRKDLSFLDISRPLKVAHLHKNKGTGENISPLIREHSAYAGFMFKMQVPELKQIPDSAGDGSHHYMGLPYRAQALF